MNKKLILITLLFTVCTISIYAGTTGKIFGKITNIESGDPIPAVSVILEGTKIGAASDYEGNYFIINVPPGVYNLESAGIGYQKVKVEGIEVVVDKSTKIDFELRYSDEYELTEKQEQFFLQKFTAARRIELLNLKEKDKVEYQQQLLMKYYKPVENSENEATFIYQNILQLTKQIDKLGGEYKRQDNDAARKEIQQDMMEKLEERFTLQEKKMQLEIKNLSDGIDELRKELQKFSADKESIMQRQFESFVD